jgi:hypothetical protein
MQIRDGLNPLLGQPIQAAIDRLGYPSEQRQILGDTVYVWSNQPGSVAYVSGNVAFASPLWCEIQIGTNPDGTIKRWQSRGNNGGCMAYANALSRR